MILEIVIAASLVFLAYISLIQFQRYKMTMMKRRLEIAMRKKAKKHEQERV